MEENSFCLSKFTKNFQLSNQQHVENTSKEPRYIKQFVSNVLDFTSQYGSDSSISYTAYNLTGKPSNYPDYGDFPQAFVMRTYGTWWKEVPSYRPDYMSQNQSAISSDDYVDVEFEESVYPYHVMIYETYNPGAVVRIWARNDEKGKWALLWEDPAKKCEHQPRVFAPPIRTILFKARIFRIEFNHSLLDYFTGIDAILLLGTKDFYSDVQNAKSHEIMNNEKSSHNEKVMKITQKVIELNLHNIPSKPCDLQSALKEFDKEITLIENCAQDEDVNGYFRHLPDETILKIFGYLDLKTLGRCLQLNRHLNALASDSFLYSRLTLQPYWHTFNDEALINLSLKAKHMQKLDLSWCGNYNLISQQTFIKFVKTSCKIMTHIRLNSCKFVSNNVLKALSETCDQLKEISLRNCLNITEIGFLHLTTLSSLEALDLYRTQISNNCLVPILKSNSNLKHLNIGACKILDMDEVAKTLGTYNQNLISLDLWKTRMSYEGVRYLSQCSQLEEIDLGWCLGLSTITVDVLSSLAEGCPKLRKLFLSAFRGICDRDIEPFISSCPNLEQIDLLGAHGVSPDGCLRLLCQLSKLRYLDISFCHQISDATVTNWRQLFPHVVIKRSSQVGMRAIE